MKNSLDLNQATRL